MGEWLQPKSFKLGPDRERKLADIQQALEPFAVNRSQTLRWVIDTMHILIFRDGILQGVTRAMQGLLRSTASYPVSVPAAPPKRHLTPEDVAAGARTGAEVLVQILLEAARSSQQRVLRFA